MTRFHSSVVAVAMGLKPTMPALLMRMPMGPTVVVHVLHDARPRILVGDVERVVGDAEFVGKCATLVVEHVGDDDLRAFRTHEACVCCAHAACAAGDEGDFSVELAHDSSLNR